MECHWDLKGKEGGVHVVVLVGQEEKGSRGLGGSGLVPGKLVGSLAEPELFAGLFTHTQPWEL